MRFLFKNWFLRNFKKIILPGIGTILVAGLTTYIQSRIGDRSAKIVVRQYLNTVESKRPVPHRVGGLVLDYQSPREKRRAVYLVEVANDGNAPEEELRLQVGFPAGMKVAYAEEPDLKVYRAEELSLEQNRFFMSLKQFPSQARAPVSFEVDDVTRLCETRVKVVGKEKEGKVEPIRGMQCAL